MGRTHRPFFRVCAMDARSPRNGRVIEQLGTYDPMVPDTDARAILNGERINYWISVGAQPTPKVGTLIKKYGAEGTHLEAQAAAIAKLSSRRQTAIESARAAASVKMPEAEKPAEAAPAEGEAPKAEGEAPKAEGEAAAEGTETKEAPAAEAPAAEAKGEETKADAPAEKAKAEEPKAEEPKAEEPAAEEKAE